MNSSFAPSLQAQTSTAHRSHGALGAALRAALCVLLAAVATAAAVSASPAVPLTDANDASNPVTYTAGPFFVPNIAPPAVGTTTCDAAHPCDETPLAVSVSSQTAAAKRIKITM